MRFLRTLCFMSLAFLFAWASSPASAQIKKIGRVVTGDAPQTENTVLVAAGLKAAEPQGLVNYFKQRTLSEAELIRIKAVISRMGSDVFEDREKASAEVLTFGPAAIGPLRSATVAETDFEIAYRAEDARKKIEKVPHNTVAAAAARALVKNKHPDAVAAMLGFLPLADDESVVMEIGKALVELADEGGKPSTALMAALKDKEAVRRASAIGALLDGGDKKKPIRFPDVFAQVKAVVLADADAEVKFRGLYLLLTRAKDADAVQGLIETLPSLPRGRLWQAEDILGQLAGAAAPTKARFGKSPESRDKAKGEWAKWWADTKAKVDFKAFNYLPKTDGTLLLVELDNRGWGNGKVLQLSPAMKEQWAIKGLAYPSDAAVLNDGRIIIAEQNNNRLTIRDSANTNKIEKTVQCNMPMSIDVGKDGRVLVVGRNDVYDFDDKWKEESKFSRGNHDMVGGRRLGTGEILILTNSGQQNAIKLDKTYKEIGKPFKLGTPYYMANIHLISDTEVLITENQQVAQYNMKDEKSLAIPTWKKAIPQPTCAQRLGNGNTLIVSSSNNRVVEVAPDGEELWEWSPTDGLRLQRAYRR